MGTEVVVVIRTVVCSHGTGKCGDLEVGMTRETDLMGEG